MHLGHAKNRNRKLIRETSSNERLEHKCVDLSDYNDNNNIQDNVYGAVVVWLYTLHVIFIFDSYSTVSIGCCCHWPRIMLRIAVSRGCCRGWPRSSSVCVQSVLSWCRELV